MKRFENERNNLTSDPSHNVMGTDFISLISLSVPVFQPLGECHNKLSELCCIQTKILLSWHFLQRP
jgi:hypothetical protein